MSTSSHASKPSKGWQPPTLEEMQAMLPQYEFERLLGRGGMGAVYKARQPALDRAVAIKVLPGGLTDDLDANFAERFKNEARTMAKLSHPGIVKVYDFGETLAGLLYIVMEFINGTDVAQMILSHRRLPPGHALAITAHVCDALGYAHKNGVIHRDIKPANILMNQEGAVKVADFGLAKQSNAGRGLTKTNTAMGTPDFVAPEALAPGMVVDGRADLYAVGVMLYQMLTGEIPRGMWSLPSEKVECDPRYDEVILKAMQTDRDMRYQDAIEIRRDLDAILTMPLAQSGVQAFPGQPAMPDGPDSRALPHQGADDTKPVPQSQAPRTKVKKKNHAVLICTAAAVTGLLAAFFVFSGSIQPEEFRRERTGVQAVEIAAKAVNLLELLDLQGDAVRGQWEKAPGGLLLKQGAGPQLLLFNHKAAEEYDFEIEFTLRGGTLEASQIIPLPGGDHVLWKMGFGEGNPTSFGFGSILDEGSLDAPARTEAKVIRPRLQLGRRYRSLVEVRRGSLRALIDGQEVLKWSGDQKRLKIDDEYRSKNGRLLGVGGYSSAIFFHQAEVRAPGAPSTLPGIPARLQPSVAAPPVSPLMSRGKDLAERQKTLSAPLEPGVIDALAKVSFPKDADYQWTRSDNGIQVKPLRDPGPYKSTVELPVPAAQDYAVEAWFTNEPKAVNDVGLCIPLGDRRRTTCWIWSRDGGWAGLGKVDGYDPQQPQIREGCSTSFQLVPGELSFMRVEVRRRQASVDIQFSLNGTLVAHYTGMTGRLLLSTSWRVGQEKPFHPSIGGREVAFHRVTIQPLSPAKSSEVLTFGGHRYQFSPEKLDWDEARAVAEAAGGYLATITTKEENDWVMQTFVARMPPTLSLWLGGTSNNPTHAWTWVTGEPFAFTAWGANEPNGAPIESALCFSNMNKGWGDLRANGMGAVDRRGGYLIEWDTPEHTAGALPTDMPEAVRLADGLQSLVSEDSYLLKLDGGFRSRYEAEVRKSFHAGLTALNQSYIGTGLSRARAAAEEAGDKDELAALDDEKAAVEKGAGMPAEDAIDTPAALKSLRATYREALDKLKAGHLTKAASLHDIYLKALEAYIIDLTKADKIDQARRVDELRKHIAGHPPAPSRP